MSEIIARTDFEILRYSNCWEDADILLKALEPKPNATILSIGSAGDNTFSLLSTNPELVIAVDLSETQLHLIELKKAAIHAMEREEFLEFIGVNSSAKRIEKFNLIKQSLASPARNYWESNTDKINTGLIFAGKFEQYFQFFRKWLLPFIHSTNTKRMLFDSKDQIAQEKFYNEIWNNKRWQLMFRMFFSKATMGKYGRDPEFLKEVKVPVHRYIFQKSENHLRSVSCQQNYLLRMIIQGAFGESLPHYMRVENYNAIRSNLPQLRTMKGYAQDAMKGIPNIAYCNFSNIFEYMPENIFKDTANEIANFTPVGSKMVYWNLMVPRRLARALPEKFAYDPILSNSLSTLDKGFFYNGVHIDIRK